MRRRSDDPLLRTLGLNRWARRAIARQPRARTCLALTGVAFAAAKGIATPHYVPRGATVYDASFGFGDYVRSLREDRRFEWCLDGTSLYAARMPLLPVTYACLGQLSESLRAAGLLKNLALSAFTAAAFTCLLREFSSGPRAEAAFSAVCALLAASPPVVKHASAVDYEEGFLLELLFVWCVAFLWMTRSLGGGPAPSSPGWVSALTVGSSLAAAMLKTAMTPIFALSQVVACLHSVKQRHYRSLVTVLVALVPPLLWGLRNRRVTGRFALRTSWDGENLYRGWSSEGVQLYPDVCLDRMFDSRCAYKVDGSAVRLSPKPGASEFEDEWAWDEHYRRLSRAWLSQSPIDGVRFTLAKVRNFFVSTAPSPRTYGVDARDARGSGGRRKIESVATSGWLLVGRGLELLMVAMVARLWASGQRDRRALVLGVAAANGAYALPYLVGFNYERHVTVYLVLVAGCVAVMADELV